MSLIQTTNCCDKNNTDYTITYKNESKKPSQICKECLEKSFSIKLDESTTIDTKIFQYKVEKIICNSCKMDVTKTMRCESCHPVLKGESN